METGFRNPIPFGLRHSTTTETGSHRRAALASSLHPEKSSILTRISSESRQLALKQYEQELDAKSLPSFINWFSYTHDSLYLNWDTIGRLLDRRTTAKDMGADFKLVQKLVLSKVSSNRSHSHNQRHYRGDRCQWIQDVLRWFPKLKVITFVKEKWGADEIEMLVDMELVNIDSLLPASHEGATSFEVDKQFRRAELKYGEEFIPRDFMNTRSFSDDGAEVPFQVMLGMMATKEERVRFALAKASYCGTKAEKPRATADESYYGTTRGHRLASILGVRVRVLLGSTTLSA